MSASTSMVWAPEGVFRVTWKALTWNLAALRTGRAVRTAKLRRADSRATEVEAQMEAIAISWLKRAWQLQVIAVSDSDWIRAGLSFRAPEPQRTTPCRCLSHLHQPRYDPRTRESARSATMAAAMTSCMAGMPAVASVPKASQPRASPAAGRLFARSAFQGSRVSPRAQRSARAQINTACRAASPRRMPANKHLTCWPDLLRTFQVVILLPFLCRLPRPGCCS